MMLDAINEINWLATGVAAIVYFALGGVWFSARVLGPTWDRALDFKRPDDWWPGATYFLGPLIGCIVATFAVSLLVNAIGTASLFDAVALGAIIGVGFALPVSTVNAITPRIPRPLLYGTVTGMYHTAGIVIVALILTFWS
jgi:hypothetical protein